MLFTGLLFFILGNGQDNCTQAVSINLPNNGFDPVADTRSADIDITGTTIESGESFAPGSITAGQNQKSIWFRFNIPTARSVTITVGQAGTSILPGEVGFAVYKSSGCLPSASELSNKLTALADFGSRSNSCLEAGTYLIQVSARGGVSGFVYVQVQTALPAPSSYDFNKDAYDFGVITPSTSFVSYDINCQTIDHPSETCPTFPDAQEYTKSTWHVFTTSSSVTSLLFSIKNATAPPGQKIGFILYKGNAQYSAVTSIGSCDIVITNASRSTDKIINCSVLEPNTAYSIVLFFHTDFNDNIQLGLASTEAIIQTTNVPLCNALDYTLPWGQVVSVSGTYRDTLKAVGGCDSLVRVVDVKFYNVSIKKDTIDLCRGKSTILPWGEIATQPGIYSDTVNFANTTCDSLIQTVLVKQPFVPKTTTSVTACPGFSYTLPWGQVVTTSGLYGDTLKGMDGCDSLVKEVNVSFSNNYDIRFGMDSTCQGQTYTLPWGATATTTGTYFDTIRRASGCDSIISMFILKIKQVTIEKETVNLCTGSSYTLPWGAVADSAGTYSDTIRYTGKLACDSLVRQVDLSFEKPGIQVTEAFICSNGNYTLPWGQVATTPGIYTDTLKAVAGCDSVIREVRLLIQITEFKDTTILLCAGENYTLPWGDSANTQGSYSHTVKTSSGCDSLVLTINLIVQTLKRDTTVYSFCTGQNYTLPWGEVTNRPGVYRDTIHYTTGCDSLIRLVDLTETTVVLQDTSVSICKGSSFILPWGEMITTEGVYKDTLYSSGGCDSLIRSVDISFKPVITDSNDVSICSGSYQLPWGPLVSTPGTYRDTIHYPAGCDSLIRIINLTVGSPIVETKDTTICSGQAFILPGGMVATTPGIYTDTLKAVAGCDSVIYVITLSVQSIKRDTLEASFCEGSSFALPWGEVVTISGIYQDTVTGISGCDSLIQRVELVINTVLIKEDSVNICPGTSYTLPWGPVTSSNGVYKDTLHYNNGCDSLVQIVRVTVLPVFRQNIQASFCAGSSYTLPWGITTNIPGLYTDTGRYSTGCDSVIRVVDLQLNAITRENDSLILCPGKSYTLPWGLEITSAGLYSDTVKGKGGCDSVVRTVTVIEANTLIQKDTVFFCAGSSYTLPWGHVVSMQGAYSDTIRYSTGCDSLIQTIYLEQSPGPIYETLDATFCSGQSYTLPWGLVVNATGVYHDTIKAAGGCDSLIRKASINFTPASTTTIDTSICFGGQYVLPSGTSVNATGIYRDTAKAIGGCDSLIIITKLVVLAPTQQTTNIVINEGESYTLPWGTVVTTPGIYRDTLYYQRGCDSVLRSVNVSLANIPLVSIKESFCSGGSYTLPWGQVVSSTGTYRDTLSGTNGADSLIMEVILSHQVTQSQTGSASFCEGSTYTLPWGLLVTKAGIYRDTLKTAGGCDSLVRVVDLALEAAPFVTLNKSNDVTCTASSARLTATGGSAYKWWPSESLDKATISDPVANPLESTVYHVQVTTATGCQSEDSIIVYVTTGDSGNNYLVPNAFTPDGDGKNDCFGIKHWGPVTELSFTIYDRWGGIVFQTSDPSRCWDGTGKTSLLPTGSFVYFIKAKTMCGPVMRKGTVTLIR